MCTKSGVIALVVILDESSFRQRKQIMRTTPIKQTSVKNLDLELKAVESLISDCLEVARGLPQPSKMTAKLRAVALETVNSLKQANDIRERLLLHRHLIADLCAN